MTKRIERVNKQISEKERQEYTHKVFQIFNNNPSQSYNVKQITSRLGTTDRSAVSSILKALEKDDIINRMSRESFRLSRRAIPTIQGKVAMTASGMAFIVVEGRDQDIIVEPQNTSHAMHGDVVEVAIIARRRDGREEGDIVSIVKEGTRQFVGNMEIVDNKFGFVVADNRKMPFDIFVPAKMLNGAKNGQKVIVKILEWNENSKNPLGQVIDVLGDIGDNNAEMHAILAQYNLPYQFPERLEELADKIPDGVTQTEIHKRRDMRNVTTMTIDPADAKDFDDALSLDRLENGNWEVGVHIADVTYYVREGSEIDNEAIERGTSVYLVDRTVPMLPEKLSNALCSLRPDEEKLCFSVIFEMTEYGKIMDQWFGRTVIKSDHRYDYDQAQVIIEAGAEAVDPNDKTAIAVVTMDRLAKILRKERFSKGSIGFERDEAKFILDQEGKPTGVYFKEMKDSNHLIEEFMLLANRSVASFIGQNRGEGQQANRTFVYRIHDKPNEDKFNKFKTFITRFGYNFHAQEGVAVAKELTQLLQEIKGKKEENLLSTLAIRSMAKAAYSTENIGHYGLAFPFYTHFTSPIRRYPDMMVHRLLQRYLDGGKSPNREEYEELCQHTSDREVLAAEAERASIKYKMVEFMADKIGNEFDGSISGVTDWGIYVELKETHIEGMVSLRDLDDDLYAFNAEQYAVIGYNSGRKYTLGDDIRIRVKRADLQQKQLDFEMVGSIDFNSGELIPVPEINFKESGAKFDFSPSSRSKKKNGKSGKRK